MVVFSFLFTQNVIKSMHACIINYIAYILYKIFISILPPLPSFSRLFDEHIALLLSVPWQKPGGKGTNFPLRLTLGWHNIAHEPSNVAQLSSSLILNCGLFPHDPPTLTDVGRETDVIRNAIIVRQYQLQHRGDEIEIHSVASGKS